MSTRSTLEHSDDFHLYEEVFDGNIHLEIRDCKDFDVERTTYGNVRLRIKLTEDVIQAIAKIADVPRSTNFFNDDVGS